MCVSQKFPPPYLRLLSFLCTLKGVGRLVFTKSALADAILLGQKNLEEHFPELWEVVGSKISGVFRNTRRRFRERFGLTIQTRAVFGIFEKTHARPDLDRFSGKSLRRSIRLSTWLSKHYIL